MSSPRTTLPARIAASAAVAGLLSAGAYVATHSSDTAATTPGPPALVTLKRPVTLRWTQVPGSIRYRVYRDNVAVFATASLFATVKIPCTGSRLSLLSVAAVDADGVEGPPSLPQARRC